MDGARVFYNQLPYMVASNDRQESLRVIRLHEYCYNKVVHSKDHHFDNHVDGSSVASCSHSECFDSHAGAAQSRAEGVVSCAGGV